jgi:hypothetical protein
VIVKIYNFWSNKPKDNRDIDRGNVTIHGPSKGHRISYIRNHWRMVFPSAHLSKVSLSTMLFNLLCVYIASCSTYPWKAGECGG